ncbi:hypothetical protein [Clostridium sp. C8-1-8]|uniref:hypothetical protein n=1 Tax=Clostridium sp. C8-1-8 TaxID=2698831 RepID=UPI00136E7490|nr:hypothetical protein [Clostridium sp. C8-1-8]
MDIEEIIQQFKQSTFYMQNYSLNIYSKISSIIKLNNNTLHVVLNSGNLDVYLDRIVKVDKIPYMNTEFQCCYEIRNYTNTEILGYVAN